MLLKSIFYLIQVLQHSVLELDSTNDSLCGNLVNKFEDSVITALSTLSIWSTLLLGMPYNC